MPTLLPVCAPTHPPTPIPTPSAPLHQPTPLPPAAAAGVGVGGGSVGVVGSVTTWCTHWLCWCCPLPSHTHRACEARGGGCVWCGCHHHCAPFPPTTTTVCAAPPCPLCCVCWWWDWAQRRTVVARTLVWRCAWHLATTPTSHACRLSPSPKPSLPHTLIMEKKNFQLLCLEKKEKNIRNEKSVHLIDHQSWSCHRVVHWLRQPSPSSSVQ